MSTAEGAITRAASQLPQEEGGGDEHRKRGNDSFALSDDDSHDDRLDEQDRRQSTASKSRFSISRNGHPSEPGPERQDKFHFLFS
mgnify:CR=1 FL=1